MITLIRWRIRKNPSIDPAQMRLFARLSGLQVLLLVAIILVAGGVARGLTPT